MDLNEAGRRHRELREGRGWSLVDEEDRSGVHRNTINGFEMGKRKPRPSTLRKLAESLGVDVEDLTGTPKAKRRSSLTYPPGDRRSGASTTWWPPRT